MYGKIKKYVKIIIRKPTNKTHIFIYWFFLSIIFSFDIDSKYTQGKSREAIKSESIYKNFRYE